VDKYRAGVLPAYIVHYWASSVKSYFLAPIESRDAAITALKAVLPEENKTWLLKDTTGDVMAYFYLVEPDGGLIDDRAIVADISGRHYDCEADVMSVLQKLKEQLGGEITDDA
jgi:hypothetical protein